MAKNTEEVNVRVRLTDMNTLIRQANRGSKSIKKLSATGVGANRAVRETSSVFGQLKENVLSADMAQGRLSHSLGITGKAVSALKYGAVAAGAAGTAFAANWIRSGVKLNDNYATLVARMGVLTGSAQEADKVLSTIRDNNDSPMRFTVQAEAAAGLAASGVANNDIPNLITALSNTALTAGGDMESNMGQLGEIFAQVQARGRLTGESVDRIQSMGIDVLGVLKEQFDLSGDQLTKIADQDISADKFLAAWTKHGTDGPIAEAAKVMAETPDGIHRNMVKNWEKLQRVSTQKIAVMGTDIKKKLRDALGNAGAALDKGGVDSMMKSFDNSFQLDGALVDSWGSVKSIADSVASIFQSVVIPAFQTFHGIAKELPNPLTILADVLKWIADRGGVVKGVLAGLIAAYMLYRSVALTVIAVQKVYLGLMLLNAKRIALVTKAKKIWAATTKIVTGALRLLNLALITNPIGMVIAAIVALVAGFIIAYKKVGWFRNAVNAVWDALKAGWQWIKENWKLLVSIIGGPFGALVVLFINNFDKIKEVASSVLEWIKTAVSDVVGFVTGIPGSIAGAVSSVFNGIKSGIVSGLNWIIGKVNWFIRKFNGVGGFIGKLPGVPTLKIDEIGPIGDSGTDAGQTYSPLPGLGEVPLKNRRKNGGYVPGRGSGDRTPILAEPGEYVLKRKAAQQLGPNELAALNNGNSQMAVYIDGKQVEAVVRRRQQNRKNRR